MRYMFQWGGAPSGCCSIKYNIMCQCTIYIQINVMPGIKNRGGGAQGGRGAMPSPLTKMVCLHTVIYIYI